jgi:hypothetical protein
MLLLTCGLQAYLPGIDRLLRWIADFALCCRLVPSGFSDTIADGHLLPLL